MPKLPISLRRRPGEPVWGLLEGEATLREESCSKLGFECWYGVISYARSILVLISVGLATGKELEINSVLPCSAALNGIGLTAMVDFLACVGVDVQATQYMKGMRFTFIRFDSLASVSFYRN
jgi:hypothetical protein